MKKIHCYRCGETTVWKRVYNEFHQEFIYYCPVCSEPMSEHDDGECPMPKDVPDLD